MGLIGVMGKVGGSFQAGHTLERKHPPKEIVEEKSFLFFLGAIRSAVFFVVIASHTVPF